MAEQKFNKEKEFDILWSKIMELSKLQSNPMLQLQEALKLADYLEDLYNRGYEEGHKIKVIQNN